MKTTKDAALDSVKYSLFRCFVSLYLKSRQTQLRSRHRLGQAAQRRHFGWNEKLGIRYRRQWDFASFLNQLNEAGLDFKKS